MLDFSWVTEASAWVGLVTLIALEVVLGIDNIVFISILSGKVPKEQQGKAQQLGLIFAVIPRLVFLLFLGLILKMTDPLFFLPFADPGAGHGAGGGHGEAVAVATKQLGISGQDLVLLIGGAFLIVQATREIHHKLEGADHHAEEKGDKTVSLGSVLTQIAIINLVFSLDSIVTAVGMVKQITVMMIAVIVSTVLMAVTVKAVSAFIDKHPTVKMLALSFLLMIGSTLIIEALHFHIPKGYVYFAMGFSVFVEMLNIRATKKSHPVELHDRPIPEVE